MKLKYHRYLSCILKSRPIHLFCSVEAPNPKLLVGSGARRCEFLSFKNHNNIRGNVANPDNFPGSGSVPEYSRIRIRIPHSTLLSSVSDPHSFNPDPDPDPA